MPPRWVRPGSRGACVWLVQQETSSAAAAIVRGTRRMCFKNRMPTTPRCKMEKLKTLTFLPLDSDYCSLNITAIWSSVSPSSACSKAVSSAPTDPKGGLVYPREKHFGSSREPLGISGAEQLQKRQERL